MSEKARELAEQIVGPYALEDGQLCSRLVNVNYQAALRNIQNKVADSDPAKYDETVEYLQPLIDAAVAPLVEALRESTAALNDFISAGVDSESDIDVVSRVRNNEQAIEGWTQ